MELVIRKWQRMQPGGQEKGRGSRGRGLKVCSASFLASAGRSGISDSKRRPPESRTIGDNCYTLKFPAIFTETCATMDSRYAIADTHEIISPAMVVFEEILIENIGKMIAIAGSADRLRPLQNAQDAGSGRTRTQAGHY